MALKTMSSSSKCRMMFQAAAVAAASPPAGKKRRKSKADAGDGEGKKERLYCICKTKYDSTK
jgi:hypothetical protein